MALTPTVTGSGVKGVDMADGIRIGSYLCAPLSQPVSDFTDADQLGCFEADDLFGLSVTLVRRCMILLCYSTQIRTF